MASAYYTDTRLDQLECIGSFDDLATAKQACIDHAKAHPRFVKIICAEDDTVDDGFDMAVVLGRCHMRLYWADA